MDLPRQAYLEKVRGCWYGKCIGGTLGAPFECYRGVLELEGYTQDMSSGSAPNDDLDLQLVWLNAAERYGRTLNAHILAEYWLNYIVPNWSEYGACKNNLAMGLLPSISGHYHNQNRDSCGCFILSELWACLMPGHPELAVRLAFEDAIVGHADEGAYAEIFCTAMQSAAFVESDYDRLMDIGLSYIPHDCAIARVTALVRECAGSEMDWKAARTAVLTRFPSSFGGYRGLHPDSEPDTVRPGQLGYDAPGNIGLMLIGLLYGKGDFGKSICIAAGCCEDADCTAGTLAALLGILHGASALPKKWLQPIGSQIRTNCINLHAGLDIPGTVEELTRRVGTLMPVFLYGLYDMDRQTVHLNQGEALYGRPDDSWQAEAYEAMRGGIRMESPLFTATLTLKDGIHLREGEPLQFSLFVKNALRCQQWLLCRWIMPEGWTAENGGAFALNLDQFHGGYGTVRAEGCILPQGLHEPKAECVLEIASQGHPTRMFIPVTLVVNPQTLLR